MSNKLGMNFMYPDDNSLFPTNREMRRQNKKIQSSMSDRLFWEDGNIKDEKDVNRFESISGKLIKIADSKEKIVVQQHIDEVYQNLFTKIMSDVDTFNDSLKYLSGVFKNMEKYYYGFYNKDYDIFKYASSSVKAIPYMFINFIKDGSLTYIIDKGDKRRYNYQKCKYPVPITFIANEEDNNGIIGVFFTYDSGKSYCWSVHKVKDHIEIYQFIDEKIDIKEVADMVNTYCYYYNNDKYDAYHSKTKKNSMKFDVTDFSFVVFNKDKKIAEKEKKISKKEVLQNRQNNQFNNALTLKPSDVPFETLLEFSNKKKSVINNLESKITLLEDKINKTKEEREINSIGYNFESGSYNSNFNITEYYNGEISDILLDALNDYKNKLESDGNHRRVINVLTELIDGLEYSGYRDKFIEDFEKVCSYDSISSMFKNGMSNLGFERISTNSHHKYRYKGDDSLILTVSTTPSTKRETREKIKDVKRLLF